MLDWPADSLIPACSQHPAYNSRPSTEYLGLASDRDGEGCGLQTDTRCFAYFSETLSMEDVKSVLRIKAKSRKVKSFMQDRAGINTLGSSVSLFFRAPALKSGRATV